MIRVQIMKSSEIHCECVIRSVSSRLEPDTPVSRDLELGAGAAVAGRLRAMGDLPVGAAVVTPGGDLPAAFLIHVVLQSAEEPMSREALRLGLKNGLRRAREWEVERLALPVLGVGAGNLSAEDSAEIMVPLVRDHLSRFEHPIEVILAVSSDYEKDVFLRAVELAERQASAREN
ncbi:MAG: macro domain-containing protein [Gemmatimonadota bacterium]